MKKDICDCCIDAPFYKCKANFDDVTYDPVTKGICDCDKFKPKPKRLLKVTYECEGMIASEERYVFDLPEHLEWTKKEKLQPAKLDYAKEFDVLWNMYPRKEGKTRAYKAYVKARKSGTSYEEVESGIIAYNAQIKAEKTEKTFIKHGGTWFYGECWKDEYNTQPIKPKGHLQGQATYDLEKIRNAAMNNTEI